MYARYVLRRILNAVVIFMIEMFIFSVLFTTTAEQTLRAQVQESLQSEVARLKNMTSDQIKQYIVERRAYKYRIYHLDRPYMERVLWRTWDTITLNFGNSISIKSSQGDREVWKIVTETMPRTLLLFSTSIVLEVGLGIWLGLKMAQKAGKTLDRTTSVATMVVYGMPTWWAGMIMIMLLAYKLPLFPSGGMHMLPPPTGLRGFVDLLYHMALPLITLVLINFWGVALLSRNIVLSILQEDYIMAGRARGLPERRILFGHTMRTAAPPMTTIALLSLLSSVFGNIIFEGIFSWPGMGNLYWISIEQGDTAVTLGLLAVTTGMYIIGLAFLDLIYGFLDPRIKVGGAT
jgi:peptide/nickel transport system permease protein